MRIIYSSIAITTIIASCLFSSSAFAWNGYKTETGGQIEIESYDHQGTGEGPVEYYDEDSGEYKTGYLDMHPGGSGELTDDDTGETFEVEME